MLYSDFMIKNIVILFGDCEKSTIDLFDKFV